MDLFGEDEYAERRKTIPYYPFASQPEWEMASYLLKSGLSMAAMDEFLKLQLVSLVVSLKYLTCGFSRSIKWSYHFSLPKISVIRQRYSQLSNQGLVCPIKDNLWTGSPILNRVFDGSRKASHLKVPLRTTLSSTIRIRSSAFSTSCKAHLSKTISHLHHSNSTRVPQS